MFIRDEEHYILLSAILFFRSFLFLLRRGTFFYQYVGKGLVLRVLQKPFVKWTLERAKLGVALNTPIQFTI